MADRVTSAPPKTLEAWLAEVNHCERDGELFRAYDLAMQGLIEHPDALALKHRAVLCLASTGATRQAAAKFTALALDSASETAPSRKLRMDIATLRARLAKDEALASRGEERTARLEEAAQQYEAIFAEEAAAANPEILLPRHQRRDVVSAGRPPSEGNCTCRHCPPSARLDTAGATRLLRMRQRDGGAARPRANRRSTAAGESHASNARGTGNRFQRLGKHYPAIAPRPGSQPA